MFLLAELANAELKKEFQENGSMYGEVGRLCKVLGKHGNKRPAAGTEGKPAQKKAKTQSKNALAKAAAKRKVQAHAKPGAHIGTKVVHEWLSPASGKKTDHEGCARCRKTTGTKPAVLLADMCRHTMGSIGPSHLLTVQHTMWTGKTWRR